MKTEGLPLPTGETGRLLLQAPSVERPAAEGWCNTGDLARMDAAGYIRITGRSKDVIIRGGESGSRGEI